MKNVCVLIIAALSFIPMSEAQVRDVKGGNIMEVQETPELIALVKDATELVRVKGEAAFNDFRVPGSRWRQGETYIFVLDPIGNMVVHTDPEMEGKNQLDLKDINGKPIIRGLIGAATISKPEGWYHYQWPVPGGILPRWKSSFVQLVKTPNGKSYIVGSGMYNDRMEREFVVDMVKNAVIEIDKYGKAAFEILHDPTGPFLAKDAYIFVITAKGIEIVNPAFPTIEGRNNMDMQDAQGKFLVREILNVMQTQGSGWVDYMWPKPGESVPTQKSAYVNRTILDGEEVAVGCGIYLADALKIIPAKQKMTASEMTMLVRDAATLLEQNGEKAFPEFRVKGSRWFHDDLYFFMLAMDGTQIFHAADPSREGGNDIHLRDVLGRPFCKMHLETAASPEGEGWVHYMWPEPGDIFPKWKSAFVKRVTFPSGKQYVIGTGVYNMQMDKAFVEDLVNRASDLVADKGPEAFTLLRDKKGPFIFMDIYVFVDDLKGVELVNAGQPSLEGKNVMDLRDAHGKLAAREYIGAAVKNGSAWVDYYWYRPGENTVAHKYTYVKTVQYGDETYVIGAGYFGEDEATE